MQVRPQRDPQASNEESTEASDDSPLKKRDLKLA